jgi:hypothetical protein
VRLEKIEREREKKKKEREKERERREKERKGFERRKISWYCPIPFI